MEAQEVMNDQVIEIVKDAAEEAVVPVVVQNGINWKYACYGAAAAGVVGIAGYFLWSKVLKPRVQAARLRKSQKKHQNDDEEDLEEVND